MGIPEGSQADHCDDGCVRRSPTRIAGDAFTIHGSRERRSGSTLPDGTVLKGVDDAWMKPQKCWWLLNGDRRRTTPSDMILAITSLALPSRKGQEAVTNTVYRADETPYLPNCSSHARMTIIQSSTIYLVTAVETSHER